MKKKIVILVLCILLCTGIGFGCWKGYNYWKYQQFIAEQRQNWQEDCKKILKNVAKINIPTPISGYYKDYMNTSNCVGDKIFSQIDKYQALIFQQLILQMLTLGDEMLYYKGDHILRSNMKYTFMALFQSFIYHKLTGDKQYEVKNPYTIKCDFEKNIILIPECLSIEVLKISNQEKRRIVFFTLQAATKSTYSFFKTITSDVRQQSQWMEEFYNLIQLFIELIKAEEAFTNPLFSDGFMEDWRMLQYINGEDIAEEVGEVPTPYPLPFP